MILIDLPTKLRLSNESKTKETEKEVFAQKIFESLPNDGQKIVFRSVHSFSLQKNNSTSNFIHKLPFFPVHPT